jgi:hypothetical protein
MSESKRPERDLARAVQGQEDEWARGLAELHEGVVEKGRQLQQRHLVHKLT